MNANNPPEPESYTNLYMGGSKKPARKNIPNNKDMSDENKKSNNNNPPNSTTGEVTNFSKKPRTVVSVSPDDTPPSMAFSEADDPPPTKPETKDNTKRTKSGSAVGSEESEASSQLSSIKAALLAKALEKKPGKMKFFTFLVGFCAFVVAGCAAFFSVRGIALLFSGAVTGVLIMASSLEVAKLVTASFLYRYWSVLSKLLRFYLVTAVVLLIGITSLGIFGYLSDAFETTKTKVHLYEDKIVKLEGDIELATAKVVALRSEKSDIDAKTDKAVEDYKVIYESFVSRKEKEKSDIMVRLAELNAARDVVNSASGGLFSSKKKKLKELDEQQAPVRQELNDALSAIEAAVDAEYKTFMDKVNTYKDRLIVTTDVQHAGDLKALDASIEDKRLEILATKEAISNTDIGSFKFIARAFGLELDVVVKYFIFVLVLVFDPLAVTLVLAYNIALLRSPPRNPGIGRDV